MSDLEKSRYDSIIDNNAPIHSKINMYDTSFNLLNNRRPTNNNSKDNFWTAFGRVLSTNIQDQQ